MTQTEIFAAIRAERDRQDQKSHETPGKWKIMAERKLSVLMEEVGDVAKAIGEWDADQVHAELIQVAVVCVAWLESAQYTAFLPARWIYAGGVGGEDSDVV